jgi:hypothetical protein
MMRQDEVFSIGKRTFEAFECLSTHHDDVPGGELLEPFEVVRKVPGNLVPLTNDAVERHCGDGFETFHSRQSVKEPGGPRKLRAVTLKKSSGFCPIVCEMPGFRLDSGAMWAVCAVPGIEHHWEQETKENKNEITIPIMRNVAGCDDGPGTARAVQPVEQSSPAIQSIDIESDRPNDRSATTFPEHQDHRRTGENQCR